jgi:hypothetical protein
MQGFKSFAKICKNMKIQTQLLKAYLMIRIDFKIAYN